MVVDFITRGGRAVGAEARVFRVAVDVARVAETIATHVESICIFADEILWIDGLVPCPEEEVA